LTGIRPFATTRCAGLFDKDERIDRGVLLCNPSDESTVKRAWIWIVTHNLPSLLVDLFELILPDVPTLVVALIGLVNRLQTLRNSVEIVRPGGNVGDLLTETVKDVWL
jgi:hypothetical protein